MDLDLFFKHCRNYHQNTQAICKLINEISKLDKNRIDNFSKLKNKLSKLENLENLRKSLLKEFNFEESLNEFINKCKTELNNIEKHIKQKFGTELDKELKKIGISLAGQYPDLRAGLFTIETDFDKQIAHIWFGPKKEKLTQCKLLPSEIAKTIEEIRKNLGSNLEEKILFDKLNKAYMEISGGKKGVDVPIIEILPKLAFLLQNSKFLNDPRKDNFRGYSRADFSYDLYRLKNYKFENLFGIKIHLKVATRAHTTQKSQFLWIPDNEKGDGTNYSHIRIEGVS